jgi:hypothetical protein
VVWYLAVAAAGCSKPDGSACQSDSECAVKSKCVYRIADGCAAGRTCQANPTGPTCNLVTQYCGCDGTVVGVGCDLASGYARSPVVGPENGSCTSVDGGGGADGGGGGADGGGGGADGGSDGADGAGGAD